MKRILIMFLFLFTCVCILTVHAGEQVNYKTDELSAVAEDVAELEALEKGIVEFCDGEGPLNEKIDEAIEEIAKKAEEAKAAFEEIQGDFEQSWAPLPESTREQLLERLCENPNLRLSDVRDLCPEDVSFVDFAKMVNVVKRHFPVFQEYVLATAAHQQALSARDEAWETVLKRLEETADAKKLAILLKLMEGCPGFNDEGADFPLDELLAPLSALVQRFGWKEKELFEEAENVWFTARPCMSKPGARMVKTVNGIEYAFRWCPAGTFTMGSPSSEPDRNDDETQHSVTLTRGFWMLETEVTQAMWKSVMGTDPSDFEGAQNPVERVSWHECDDFCKKLSSKLRLTVSLPTEAQWEYACRAGTTGAYAGDLGEMGWYDEDFNTGSTHPVGQKKPNAWGLYDMHGNVWEWCQDWYGSYTTSPTSDPTGPNSGSYRVFRGGSWYHGARLCRSAYRNGNLPDSRFDRLGFRLVLASPVPEE